MGVDGGRGSNNGDAVVGGEILGRLLDGENGGLGNVSYEGRGGVMNLTTDTERREGTKKLKNFSFKETGNSGRGEKRGLIKQLLLQCVRQHGAHLVAYRELNILFAKVLAEFFKNLLNSLWKRML